MRLLIPIIQIKSPKESTTLTGQFYEEILHLSRKMEKIKILTAECTGELPQISRNLEVFVVKSPKIPKIAGFHRIFAFVLNVIRLIPEFDCLFIRTFSMVEMLCLITAKIFGKKCVFLVPGTWIFELKTLKSEITRLIFCISVMVADCIILYSHRMIEPVRKHAPTLDLNKVRIIPNGVDTERFKPGLNAEFLRRKLGLKKSDKVVLYVGRLTPQKGLEDLIKAVDAVLKSVSNARFVIVGDGDSKCGGFRAKLEEMASSRGCGEAVLFVGPMPNRLIPYLDNLADVFVMPSRGGEGITRAMLEAMSCSVPAVSTNVAGNPDAVIDGETGYIIKPRDHETLAKKLITLLKDEKLRKGMGEKARKLIIGKFDMKTNIEKLAETLEEMCGKERRGPFR